MNVLCLNTAFALTDIVLEKDGKVCALRTTASAKTSESVMPAIDQILFENGLDIDDVDVIAVVVGTGSFTGVRIGVSLVKGFVAAFPDIKIVAINSLDLMAFEYAKNVGGERDFAVIQNALSGRFFVKEFDALGLPLGAEKLVGEYPENLFLVGLEGEKLSGMDFKIEFTAENLLLFAKQKIERAEFTSAAELAPIYLRLSQAEENLLKVGQDAKD